MCPECAAVLPEGMRFCLQCGAPLPAAVTAGTSSPIPSPAAPPEAAQELPPARPAPSPKSTISLRIAPSPVIAPREGVPLERPRSNLGRNMVEFDEEVLKKAIDRPVVQPGTVLCRFCKGPLHLEGDFCEQCGAPVADAAPRGTLKPQPQPVPPAGSPVESAPAASPTAGPSASTQPNADAPIAPTPPDFPTPDSDPQPGLMGRLKGLFKKD
jgi:hypothetical protein